MAHSLLSEKVQQNKETSKKVGVETVRVHQKLRKYISRHNILKIKNYSTDRTQPNRK